MPAVTRLKTWTRSRDITLTRLKSCAARVLQFAAEGLSSYFVWLNRGKQSLTANIKEPADQVHDTPRHRDPCRC